MKKSDLNPENFPDLEWETGKYAEPLAKLVHYSTQQATNAIRWYYTNREGRRIFCRMCRLAAILLTAFAGLLPLVNEIMIAKEVGVLEVVQTANASTATSQSSTNAASFVARVPVRHSPVHPLWSGIAVAIAATMIMIDRFYGFTTGWVRYLLTAQQLTQTLENFRFEIERQRLGWSTSEPNPEQAKAMAATLQQFCDRVRSIIADETKAWASEFADVLKQLDEQMKIASQANQRSALLINVVNGDQCSNGWDLSVDERSSEKRTGKEASIDVAQGMHIVRISGEIAGKQLRAEQPIKVGSGEIGKLTMTLT